MFYKHRLENLGVKYSFPEILDGLDVHAWCEKVHAPSKGMLDSLAKVNVQKKYHQANHYMEEKSVVVNRLFDQEIARFLEEERHSKVDTKYFCTFLQGHFAQAKHLRALIVELLGGFLLDAQAASTGLVDDLKTRRIINQDQYSTWVKTLDYLALSIELLNAASYSADDAFDQTRMRYGLPTVFKTHGHFAGTLSADILVHSLGNFVFYKTIREHEKGVEQAYLSGKRSISVDANPYSLKWQDEQSKMYVYINPEQYMDVWEVWSWAWYLVNSGQIRDLHEFDLSAIASFDVSAYASRAYRLSGSFIECASHLASAFMGCGYWAGRQSLGKWGAMYGLMVQARNDLYDYVVYATAGSKHRVVKGSHEDVSLGRVTLPLGYAYAHAPRREKARLRQLAQVMADKKAKNKPITVQEKLELNALIAANGGFAASKRFIFNASLWALTELLGRKEDFAKSERYWQLVAWTISSLNVLMLLPEQRKVYERALGDFFNLEVAYAYLKTL